WHTVWHQAGVDLGWIGVSGTLVVATGVEFPTSGTGTLTGTPVLLLGHETGGTWRLMRPSLPPSDGGWGSAAVDWVSSSLALASTAPWAIRPTPQPLLISRDGGHHWAAVDLPGGSPTGGISAVSATTMFATGAPASAPARCQGAIWKSSDGGQHWAMLQRSCSAAPLHSVQFLTDRLGFAGGGQLPAYAQPPGRVLLETSNGGASWSVRSEETSTRRLSSPIIQIHFTTPDRGTLLTGGCSLGSNGPCPGHVYTTDDGGRTLRPTNQAGTDLAAVGSTDLWVIGFLGPLVHASSDGGRHWTTLLGIGQAVAVDGLSFQAGSLIASTALGAFASANGGRTWRRVSSASDGVSVGYAPPHVLVTDGDSLLVGAVWGSSGQTRVDFPAAGALGLSSVAFATARRGILLGAGAQCLKPQIHSMSAPVFVTDDGGRQWHHVSNLPLADGQVAYSGDVAVVLGQERCHQRLATSRDGGRKWTLRPVPQGCTSASVTSGGVVWLTCLTPGLHSVTYLATGTAAAPVSTEHRLHGPAAQALFVVSARGELFAVGGRHGADIIWTSLDGGRTWHGSTLHLPGT
ncbi:MAG TPA: hypothetical protein VMW49_03135, partial [Candidatus Dormibacteraeota bacterium]|nr:hypothetical protein [Candidatus Dormibacteraeota bacterium]